MKKIYFFIFILFSWQISIAQSPGLICSIKEIKNEDGHDPIIVKTCFYKNFRFISTSYPDYAGRYFSHENEVFERRNNKFIKTTNSKVFNNRQGKLLDLINGKIQEDFNAFKKNPNVSECLSELDSIPTYKMDELEISFNNEEIWFEVHWSLNNVCRSVDGTIVTFKLNEIRQYLN